MALYAIGDLHLSLSSNKPMEIFGDGWRDYVARIREAMWTSSGQALQRSVRRIR